MSRNASRFTACQFQHIWVLLLRHETRSGGVAFVKMNKSELRAAIEDRIFCEPAQMYHDQRCGGEHLDDEITIRNRVQTVRGYIRETDLFRHFQPVNGIRVA